MKIAKENFMKIKNKKLYNINGKENSFKFEIMHIAEESFSCKTK